VGDKDVFLLSTSWVLLFVALALVMTWQSMASRAILAIMGDSLPRERRAMGLQFELLEPTSDALATREHSDGFTGLTKD
jgi:hypothetical protein